MTTVSARSYVPLRPPVETTPVRMAFVGQSTYFDYCSLEVPAGGIVPAFVDYRYGLDPAPMLERVAAFRPDVIFAWRPEIFPPGVFDDFRALTVGYLTEPIPRSADGAHPDLERRMRDLEMLDAGSWDRIVSFDPLVADTVDRIAPVWRSFALPVSDRFFMTPHVRRARPRTLFTGRSTEHRESFLASAKHEYDVIHIVHGVTDERLLGFLREEVDIGLNLHNEPYPSFENRVCVYAAAGLLVVSEPLSPTHGLEPGIDYLEVRNAFELLRVLWETRENVRAFDRIRIRARSKAERYRASRVFPALVGDLVRDVRAFGSGRRRRGHR